MKTNILKELREKLPSDVKISEVKFEGSEIMVYTKSKDFFRNSEEPVKRVVKELKKRIEIRPDLSITMDLEKAKETINKIVPEGAGIKAIYFEPELGKVVIEAQKPGLVIGKGGETFKKIKNETLWLPKIERAPVIESEIVRAVRNFLHSEIDYRKKFLNMVGQKINTELPEIDRKKEWIRMTSLGGFRQVGRSSILIQTKHSNVLLDCGIEAGSDDIPYINIPEFDLDKLDAIVVSHAHLDHVGFIPYLYKQGYKGPMYCTAPSRDLMVLLCMDYIDVCQNEGKEVHYNKKDIEKAVKHSIVLDYGEVSDITPNIRLTLQQAGHLLGSSLIHLHIGEGLYNILYSLDWMTPVTIIDPSNNVFFKPIGEVIDQAFKKHPNLVTRHSHVEEMPNIEKIKTISFNPETYKTEVREITSFIRHPISEDLYQIETESGKRVIVTGSHSLFSVINGDVKAIKVQDLKKGDFIVGPKNLPSGFKNPVLNLFEQKTKLRIHINNDNLLRKILNQYREKLNKKRVKNSKEILNWIKEYYKYGMYKTKIAKKYHVSPKRIRKAFKELGIENHPRVKQSFSAYFKISKDFARFLGYFIAEGFIREKSNTVQISNNSLHILKDAHRIIKQTFNIDGDIRSKDKISKDNVVLFYSKQLRLLLSDILNCGKTAYEKRVPRQLLFAPKGIVANFLYGYFSGDGGIRIRKKGRTVSVYSKNPDIIQDVNFMLLHFGIVPRIQFNRTNKMHSAHIYGADQIANFLENINMYNVRTNELKSNLDLQKRKSSFDLMVPVLSLSASGQQILSGTPWGGGLSCGISYLEEMDLSYYDKKIINSDFVFDQIKTIKRVRPSSKFVYDFKIRDFENFLGGHGLLFLHNTGDMKFGPSRLFGPAFTDFQRVETLIMESTYGSAEDKFPPRKDTETEFMKTIYETMNRGGKVLVPSFAVGRAQEIMTILAGNNFEYPVYMEGMLWDATAIHTAYPEYLSMYLQRQIFHYGNNPFLSEIFHRVAPKERNKIIDSSEPAVIIATSGMLIGGPAIEYLKGLAPDKKDTLLFVGYQAEGTLGRRIQKGWKEIPIYSSTGKTKTLKIEMNVETVHGLSGHSGRNELINYMYKLASRPERVIINHGEARKCTELARDIHRMFRCETMSPHNMETIRLK